MLKRKDNLDFEYFNRYLIKCGYTNPPEHETDPKKVILLNEFGIFCREKYSS